MTCECQIGNESVDPELSPLNPGCYDIHTDWMFCSQGVNLVVLDRSLPYCGHLGKYLYPYRSRAKPPLLRHLRNRKSPSETKVKRSIKPEEWCHYSSSRVRAWQVLLSEAGSTAEKSPSVLSYAQCHPQPAASLCSQKHRYVLVYQ